MMRWGYKHSQKWSSGLRQMQDQESKEFLYQEVTRARREWEQACWAFQNAVGKDEVDVAIYTLEAAERKYQIQLKEAKQANVEWDVFKHGSYFSSSD
ncbi:hypothetical protein FHR92_004273 [Fontibacillus solani]|uniref:DUF2508 domain-containing protein n=2 Tax=Fontibacillus solani TaxID=1572857 RepID=A0A7W3XTG6_9BACL|nr:hypothetical protein [Fontibacillus solani]